MKLFQGIIVSLALAVLVTGFGVGLHKAYSSSPLAQQDEEIELVEKGISKTTLTYMQSKDLASILLLK